MKGVLPDGINHTLVCLFPKTKHPETMQAMGPISLCNVLFPVLSKVLENRLKPCLSSIISDKQSAFIKGRLLINNALIAFEINHYITRKTQGKHGVAVVKWDVLKAYDRLEWSFLEYILTKFGFCLDWITSIMLCVKSVSYIFIHNGEVFW